MERNIDKLSTCQRNLLSQQIINQRYLQSVENILRKNNFQFHIKSGSIKNQTKEDQEYIVQVKQSQNVKIQQNKFYFTLLKKFYDLRKIINPQMTFQTFLTLYNQELNQKVKKFKIDDMIEGKKTSNKLNKLIMQNELKILTSQTVQLIEKKSTQILKLQKQSQKVNQEYQELIQNLVQKPTLLNVENIQLQVKLKLEQKQKKNSLMQTYSKRFQNKSKPPSTSSYSTKIQNQNQRQQKNDKKQEVQRIKTVIKNNMWGYGEQISQKLQKLKVLQNQLQN